MTCQIVTLITPIDTINVSGKQIKVKNIEIIKINENGSITFIEKQEYVEPKTELIEAVG